MRVSVREIAKLENGVTTFISVPPCQGESFPFALLHFFYDLFELAGSTPRPRQWLFRGCMPHYLQIVILLLGRFLDQKLCNSSFKLHIYLALGYQAILDKHKPRTPALMHCITTYLTCVVEFTIFFCFLQINLMGIYICILRLVLGEIADIEDFNRSASARL